jgi:hypothetical protein
VKSEEEEEKKKNEIFINQFLSLFLSFSRSVSSTVISLNFGPIHIRCCLVWILLRFCYARPPVVHSRAGQGSLLLSLFASPPMFSRYISLWLILVVVVVVVVWFRLRLFEQFKFEKDPNSRSG